MNFTYWTGYSKRRNSTAKPTSTGTDKSCELKEDTSITAPTIKLQGHSYFNVTYGYIADFGRYYFVRDIRTIGPMTEIDLLVDVLATYESNIRTTSQYIERASYPTDGINAPDPLNPPTNYIEHEQTALINFTTQDALGNKLIDYDTVHGVPVSHYILGVAGKTGVKYWGLTDIEPVLKAIFGSSWISTFTSQFFGYKDCILSLKRVPYTPGGVAGQQIYVGNEGLVDPDDQSVIRGTLISELPQKRASGLTVVSFPADSHLNVRTYPYKAPYTCATITLPFVGVVPLDVSMFADDGKVELEVFLDQFTADIMYKLWNSDGAVIATYYGNCGADLPIAGQSYNAVAMGAGVLQVVGGLAGAFGGRPGSGAQAVSGALQMFDGAKAHTQANGSLSSFIGSYVTLTAQIDVYTNAPVSWDLNNMKASLGVIVEKQESLASVSGFIQCRNAHVATPGTESEKSELEALLNGGIFLV